MWSGNTCDMISFINYWSKSGSWNYPILGRYINRWKYENLERTTTLAWENENKNDFFDQCMESVHSIWCTLVVSWRTMSVTKFFLLLINDTHLLPLLLLEFSWSQVMINFITCFGCSCCRCSWCLLSLLCDKHKLQAVCVFTCFGVY